MYSNIIAAICLDGNYTRAFEMNSGVRQGCPIPPLVFSLYMDRLEKCLESDVMHYLNTGKLRSVHIARLLVPILLLADDSIFKSSSMLVMRRILDILSRFC